MADDHLVRPFRLLPRLDDAVRPFWTGGARGELTFWRCQSCGHYLHPPAPICPGCLSRHLAAEAVSGRGTLVSFTVNHKQWNQTVPVPYVIALVELAEQPGLRVLANLTGADPAALEIGTAVRVTFEREDDVWLPSFQPDETAGGKAPGPERPGAAAGLPQASRSPEVPCSHEEPRKVCRHSEMPSQHAGLSAGRSAGGLSAAGSSVAERSVVGLSAVGRRSAVRLSVVGRSVVGRSAAAPSAAKAESRAVISGVGQSPIGRRLGRSGLDLTVEAALAAIEDAGLTRDDIDGLAAHPGAMVAPAGFSGPGTPEVQDALRLNLSWHSAGMEGPAQLAPVINAVTAVAAGLARHVLVYRTVTEATAQGGGGRRGVGIPPGGGAGLAESRRRVTGFLQWSLPFHAYSAANWIALYAAAHFHRYGTTSEHLAQVALSARRYAAMNKSAVCTDPFTLDDYLAAPVITSPFRRYDCDATCDGSTAVIVSAADTAAGADMPVRFEAMGAAIRGRPSWDQWEDLTTMAARDAAAQMWSRTDLRPADVDTAQLYDGFSFLALAWLEALGFCGPGEGGPFLGDGARIAPGGELPMNTWGGQLSGGRLHGFGHLHEAVLQLRGGAGDRQVPGARVAVVSAGGGPVAGCVLLTSGR
jgi:acetyl-CoA acetyltransferase/uncharacterized OB-fold protein